MKVDGVDGAVQVKRLERLVYPKDNCRYFSSRIEQISQPGHIEKLVAQFAVKTFDIPVLRRLTWLNVD